MAKKSKRTPKFTAEELEAMTPQQKLDRIVYLQKEIVTTKDKARDRAAADREYIKEMTAQIEEITESEKNTPPAPAGSVQAEE